MQFRLTGQSCVKPATERLAACVQVVFAGVAQSTWKLNIVSGLPNSRKWFGAPDGGSGVLPATPVLPSKSEASIGLTLLPSAALVVWKVAGAPVSIDLLSNT